MPSKVFFKRQDFLATSVRTTMIALLSNAAMQLTYSILCKGKKNALFYHSIQKYVAKDERIR